VTFPEDHENKHADGETQGERVTRTVKNTPEIECGKSSCRWKGPCSLLRESMEEIGESRPAVACGRLRRLRGGHMTARLTGDDVLQHQGQDRVEREAATRSIL
jgi:hypothetical protein